jgi:hypothetical protein
LARRFSFSFSSSFRLRHTAAQPGFNRKSVPIVYKKKRRGGFFFAYFKEYRYSFTTRDIRFFLIIKKTLIQENLYPFEKMIFCTTPLVKQ